MVASYRTVLWVVHDVVNHAETVRSSVDQITKKHHPITEVEVKLRTQFAHGLVEPVNITHDPDVVSRIQTCLYRFLQSAVSHSDTSLT